MAFPPFLEVIEYIERQRFSELIISTPGTMGLTALAAARLLGLRTTGIYHTDFPEYIRRLTQDNDLADMSWKYMLWFSSRPTGSSCPRSTTARTSSITASSRRNSKSWRGSGHAFVSSGQRDAAYYQRYSLNGSFKYLYVGRLSRKKKRAPADRRLGPFA